MTYDERYIRAIEYYEVPEPFHHLIELMLLENEIKLISLMGREAFDLEQLENLIRENFDQNSDSFLKNCYKRAIIKKFEQDHNIYFKVDRFYTRLSYFAQYESKTWQAIAKDERQKLDEWCFKTYVEDIRETIEKKIKGENIPLHNSNIMTLKEAQEMIDSMEREIYLQPCNCRAIALNCSKPKNTCIQFGCEINTPADRGWGEKLTKEMAKEVLKEANKGGLIHSGEDEALCNCDGCCCYPFRAAGVLGSKKKWPKATHVIYWNEEKCIHCGKCVKMCNFGAFYKIEGNKVNFDREKCWSCTVCAENCPKGAIIYSVEHELPL
ncbi:4Fe-4S binding protein [Geosporobacter ferrireducens]|uniref:4Fe-4S ferredoxin-type domain-containing protein n=1 Tax=Geosporobacter ferrireducens TaxID=1424294 RepID=A0A1D8GII4_9FIRM|nr:4Fe-4S binding protein [Geosporobacter ferrireducens]AOT70707.1 hypothetical protein Gferi_14660 [Geosporobacter ferrireducens]MTI57513.1 4Fe-4S dicluster domain-containing protein [Geosporobacter ferrireducens]